MLAEKSLPIIQAILDMKKYYLIALFLLAVNVALFFFLHDFGVHVTPGWHTTIYPLSLRLFDAFSLSLFLTFLCFLLSLSLKKNKPLTISLLYFFFVLFPVLLFKVPYLPFKILSTRILTPEIADYIKISNVASFYTFLLVNLGWALYLISPIGKKYLI
jgi:hypothetical protein